MPETEVILFADDDEAAPFLVWLDGLTEKAQIKVIVRVERLAAMGHELRRPEADYLRDGVYELRVSLQRIQYRVLYFFHGKQAVISHGLTKTSQVPPKEIDLAVEHRSRFEEDPERHTYGEWLP
jgi:phage-related protein